jgi:hypothetical protein
MAILCSFKQNGIEESLSGEWQLHVLTDEFGSGSSTPKVLSCPLNQKLPHN